MQLGIVIASCRSLIRAACRSALQAGPDISVLAEAESGHEAVELGRHLHPDAVLIDARIAECDCVEATSQLSSDPEVPVILLSAGDDDERMFAALRAGATGVLSEDTELGGLVHAVEAATSGDAVLPPGLTRRVIAELVSRPDAGLLPRELAPDLTAREREVVALVGRGLSNDEIAEQLVVSAATARTHVSRAMVKLGARDRAQLVVFAYESVLLGGDHSPALD